MTITGNYGIYRVAKGMIPSIVLNSGVLDENITNFTVLEPEGRRILIHRETGLDSEKRYLLLKFIAELIEEEKSINLMEFSRELDSKNIPTNSSSKKENKEDDKTLIIKKENILLKGNNASIEIKDGNIVLRTLGKVRIYGEEIQMNDF